MPFRRTKRSYGSRRKAFPKRTYRKRSNYPLKKPAMYATRPPANYEEAAMSAWQLAKYAYSALNVELKYHDVSFSDTATTAQDITPLTAIGQGDTDVLRNGEKIRVKQVNLTFHCEKDAVATQSRVRIMIFRWKDSGLPSGADLLENTTDLRSYRAIDSASKVEVLIDEVYTLDSGQGTAASERFSRNVSFPVKYTGAGATDYEWGTLWVMVISDQATNPCPYRYEARVRFTDN